MAQTLATLAALKAERPLPPGTLMWGHGSREELMAESPHLVFERPADWLGLLG